MKSERRHELQHNELADWLQNAVDAMKPYTNVIIGGLLGVAVLVAATTVWMRLSERTAANAWGAYGKAIGSNSVADLETVANNYASASAGQWAALAAADTHLLIGCNALFEDKVKAKLDLTRAVDGYLGITQRSSVPELRARATFGLARAYEAQGDLAKATAEYQKVSEMPAGKAFAEAAKQRVKTLQDQPTREFYDQFAKFTPKPPEKTPPKLPFDVGTLNEPPTAKTDAAKTDAAKTDAKPAETKPAESKPAESKPADAKPAESKPAESKPAEKK